MKRLMTLPLAALAACGSVQMPTVQMPAAQMPTMQAPSVQMPSAQMPGLQMPNVQAPSVTMPQAPNLPQVPQMPQVTVPTSPRVPSLPVDEAGSKASQSTKDALRNIKSDRKPVVLHAYVGSDEQTVADIKLSCVIEATQKLAQVVGTDVRTTVLENEVITLKGRVVANCKLAVQE